MKWQSEMGIQFWCILYDMKLSASSIQVLLWYDYGYDMILYFYELCFLWFILCMVEYNPLLDSCNKIQLSFKYLVTKSVLLHKFVLIVPLILNFVFHFMSYRSLMLCDFPISLIIYQFSLDFDFIELFLKDFFNLEPMWSRFNFRDNNTLEWDIYIV